MKDPIEILAERLARLEQDGHISPAQRQNVSIKLSNAKNKKPPKPPKGNKGKQ